MKQTREKQAAREERPWPVLFPLPEAPSFGACILATMNQPILSYSHAVWPRWNQEEEHQLSSAWAPAGRRGGLQPTGKTQAAWGGDHCLLGDLGGCGWRKLGMSSHVPLGLYHICSELLSASATLALWMGPNGMQPRIFTGNFLEDISPSPACGLQVHSFWEWLYCFSGEGDGSPLQYCLQFRRPWWAAVHGVAKSRTRLSDFTFTFHFRALEKEMATHSSVLAWRIPGMGEPGGLPSMGLHRVGHN